MLEHTPHSLHLLHHQRMTLYAFGMQQQHYYPEMLPPSPPPIQVPSQQRLTAVEHTSDNRNIHPGSPQQISTNQHRPNQTLSNHSPASSNSQSFSHHGSPLSLDYDQEAYSVPFLTEWANQTWPSEVLKQLPSTFTHQAPIVQNSADSVVENTLQIPQSAPHQNGYTSQPSSFFTTDHTGSFVGGEFNSSFLLASPPDSQKSDVSQRRQSQGHSSPMAEPTQPIAPTPANLALTFGTGDFNMAEPIGIKCEKEFSPQAAYDPRALTSNPASVPETSPRHAFNGLFNPTDPPLVGQQDMSESSSFESSEEDPSSCLDPVVPTQLHDTEHGSRSHRSPRIAPPVPIPHLTKKSRGRRVPTSAYMLEDGLSKDRPFACTVPDCGKVRRSKIQRDRTDCYQVLRSR